MIFGNSIIKNNLEISNNFFLMFLQKKKNQKEIKVLEKVVFFTFNSLDEIIGNHHHI